MTLLKTALLVLAMLLFWVWFVGVVQPAPYRLEVAPGGMERIEARLKRHGVKSAVCGQDGCFFFRDGKRIKL